MVGSVLIFVVEDDALVQESIQHALEDGGYAVTTASSGEEAISMLEANGADFRALMTDVNLGAGKLTGWDVAQRARELKPELPVIYMTGDNGHQWASQGVPNSVLLNKPFALAQAVAAVSNLLNVTG